MRKTTDWVAPVLCGVVAALISPALANAAETAPNLQAQVDALAAALEAANAQSAYMDTTLLLLFSGMVVMFMAAGFCALESGLVRERNAAVICLKNISLYAIAGLAFYGVGYQLMYDLPDGGRFIGSLTTWAPGPLGERHGDGSDSASWFFQMVFVATAASIVSGALAERTKLVSFLIFVGVLTALIYPIQGAWTWGGGWLAQLGFVDFAGSTIVHSVGGWAALTGAILVGPRAGRFDENGRGVPMPGSNLPLAALGVFILWLGWFGFNAGSQLTANTVEDANAIAKIMANTNTAAAAGVVTALILSSLANKRPDLALVLNGAIGGLVAITAQPLAPAPWQAAMIGAVGGVLIVFVTPLLERAKIDDVVGAIPAHLACGVWGTLAAAFTVQAAGLNIGQQLGVQLLGIVAIGAFAALTSLAVWLIIGRTIGLKASEEDQHRGMDHAELGVRAYPYFAPPNR